MTIFICILEFHLQTKLLHVLLTQIPLVRFAKDLQFIFAFLELKSHIAKMPTPSSDLDMGHHQIIEPICLLLDVLR